MPIPAPQPTVDRGRSAPRWGRRAGGALVAGLLLTLAPAPAATAGPTGCPPGIDDPGLVTFDQALGLERVQGTDDEYLARMEAGFAAIDRNGDGALCLKAVSKLRGASAKQLGTYYHAVDNSHPNK